MDAFHEALERRIEQFRRYLALMTPRRRTLTQGDCFIIFEDRYSRDDKKFPRLAKLRRPTSRDNDTVPDGGFDVSQPSDWDATPEDDWRGDRQRRFVQFSFNLRYFDMDLPNTTLFPEEAATVLRRKTGFFFNRDNPAFADQGEAVKPFNPLRKIYGHGDEGSAAEDMAFVFFDVWKFPVDCRLYVTAMPSNDLGHWERGVPID